METALVTGSWGDVLASYGKICKYLKENNKDSIDVVYFGLDLYICDFLNLQPNINEVKQLLISEPAVYFKYNHMAAHDFEQFMQVTEMNEQIPDLIPMNVNKSNLVENPTDCFREFSVTLLQVSNDLPDHYVLFQPYSIRSCNYAEHWKYWMEALDYVLETSSIKVVLVGEIRSKFDVEFTFPFKEHPNLINLVGQTKSMMEVFNIAKNADQIITTSNCLSMFSAINKIPAIVVCNGLIEEKAQYYFNWINVGTNMVLDNKVSLEIFKQVYENSLIQE